MPPNFTYSFPREKIKDTHCLIEATGGDEHAGRVDVTLVQLAADLLAVRARVTPAVNVPDIQPLLLARSDDELVRGIHSETINGPRRGWDCLHTGNRWPIHTVDHHGLVAAAAEEALSIRSELNNGDTGRMIVQRRHGLIGRRLRRRGIKEVDEPIAACARKHHQAAFTMILCVH